jgi:hypothetical protein
VLDFVLAGLDDAMIARCSEVLRFAPHNAESFVARHSAPCRLNALFARLLGRIPVVALDLSSNLGKSAVPKDMACKTEG